jgi:hypothetical protein
MADPIPRVITPLPPDASGGLFTRLTQASTQVLERSVANPANPISRLVVETLGFHAGVSGKGFPLKPSPLILTYAAPQPIGLVPPSTYGLPDDYFFGFTTHEMMDIASGQAVENAAARLEQQRQRLLSAARTPGGFGALDRERLNQLRGDVERLLPNRTPITAAERAEILAAIRAQQALYVEDAVQSAIRAQHARGQLNGLTEPLTEFVRDGIGGAQELQRRNPPDP